MKFLQYFKLFNSHNFIEELCKQKKRKVFLFYTQYRTETNMAYRRADHERWQQMDFVLGIKIELSNQHPVTDICDFVQGDYPKDFVFDGWHPQCFCYATPILISEDEMAKVSEAFARGETYIPKGKPVTDTPKGFKKWVKDHKEQIQGAKNPPYWVRNNKAVVNGIWRKKNYSDIAEKVNIIANPQKKNAYVSFDPVSPTVIEKIQEKKNQKQKLKLFDEILNDERAKEISNIKGKKTVVFPGHKGSQHETWQGIIQMAKDINKTGESVIFLPELHKVSSADALVLFHGKPTIADFKYCVTKKTNTLIGNLKDGFNQANTVVIKLENMDMGAFREAIEYFTRNDLPYGNIKIINKYGKILEISTKDIRYNFYKKKIKGFF